MSISEFDEENVSRQRFAEVDEATEDLRDLLEGTKWSRQSFLEMFDISWIYHENGLDGVVLTYPEIKSAVDNQIISDVSLLPTYRYIKNHKACIDLMREKARAKRFTMSIDFFKEIHGLLVDDEELAGEYRRDIPIHRTYFHEIAPPADIPERLQAVADYAKSKHDADTHPLEVISRTHHKFMRTFPFSKISGLVGRQVMNHMLFRHGYFPAVIHATDRQRYYEALRGEEGHFHQFLSETLENSVRNATKFVREQSRGRRPAIGIRRA